MTVATPALREEMAERWRNGDQRPVDAGGDHVVKDALYVLHQQMVGKYYQREDDDLGEPLAHRWVDGLCQAMRAAGVEAWEQHVVPAVAAAAVEHLRANPPPAHLVAFEGGEELRQDLEAVSRK